MEYPALSKGRERELAKLRQKKYRLSEGLVVIEGLRTLRQLHDYGITPREQYVGEGIEPVWPDLPACLLKDWELAKICDSEHNQGVAALFPLPKENTGDFQRAFYLDGISDPGNLGTIFRLSAAFGLDKLLLSADCVEVSSPKVIRASLGSVYRIPFQIITGTELQRLGAAIYVTDTAGQIDLKGFAPGQQARLVIALGSEAHGISAEIRSLAAESLRVEMGAGMESLNVAVAAGIIAHHLFEG